MRASVLTAILPAVLLAGCQKSNEDQTSSASSGVAAPAVVEDPSVPDITALRDAVRQGFQQYVDTHDGHSGTQFITNVSKIDGQQITVAGAPGYRAIVNAVIIMPNGYRPQCAQPGGPICFLSEGLKPTAASTRVAYKGSVELSRSERGWMLNAVNINFNTPDTLIVDLIQPPGGCWKRLVTKPQYDQITKTEGKAPDVSFLTLKADNTINFNGITPGIFELDTLMHSAAQINPPPPAYIIYTREPGSSDQTDADIKNILAGAKFCNL